jgi:hypothetical protein
MPGYSTQIRISDGNSNQNLYTPQPNVRQAISTDESESNPLKKSKLRSANEAAFRTLRSEQDDITESMPQMVKPREEPNRLIRTQRQFANLQKPVLDEAEIRDSYYWQMEAQPEKLENPKSRVGLFDKPDNTIKLIMEYVDGLKKDLLKVREQKDALKSELGTMGASVDLKLDESSRKVWDSIGKYKTWLQLDAQRHMQQRMDRYKEILEVRKSKIELIKDLREKMQRVVEIEKNLFGCEMFNLKRIDCGNEKDIKASAKPH